MSFSAASLRSKLYLIVQDADFRGLVSLGVAAIGGTTVAAFGSADTARYTAIAAADAVASKAGPPGIQGSLLLNGNGAPAPAGLRMQGSCSLQWASRARAEKEIL